MFHNIYLKKCQDNRNHEIITTNNFFLIFFEKRTIISMSQRAIIYNNYRKLSRFYFSNFRYPAIVIPSSSGHRNEWHRKRQTVDIRSRNKSKSIDKAAIDRDPITREHDERQSSLSRHRALCEAAFAIISSVIGRVLSRIMRPTRGNGVNVSTRRSQTHRKSDAC